MDWIRARTEWAPEPAWAALQERVEQDVTEWNEGFVQDIRLRVKMEKRLNRMVTARARHFGQAQVWVRLDFEFDAITIVREDETRSVIKPFVNFKGEGRFLQGDTELELWQASRLILEPVLF